MSTLKTLQGLYEKLKMHSDLTINSNFDIFFDCLDEIVALKDPSCISELITYLENDSADDLIPQQIIGAIETFTLDDYVKEILSNIGFLMRQSPFWGASILHRLFNNPKYYEFFKENVKLAEEKDLLNALALLEKEYPDQHQNIEEIKTYLKEEH